MMQEGNALAVVDPSEIEAKPPPTDAQLKGVRDLAAELWSKRKRLAALEIEVKDVAAAIELLEEKTIPDALREVGMESFALTGGFRVDLEPFAHGSVKKEDEPAFFAWLELAGWGGIIKHVLTISFGKGDDKWAKKFMADLAKRKRPIPVDRKDAIHASTWKSFVRERLSLEAQGAVPPKKRLPRDMVAVHEGVKAVIIDPAEEAEKKAKRTGSRKKKASNEEGVEI